MFVFSVCRLVSRRRHYISTIPRLSAAPHRTVLALLMHTAPHMFLHAPSCALCDAISFPPVLRGWARTAFLRIARPCVASFPPAALPAFFGTTRQSDSPCPLVPPLLLRLLEPSPIHGREHGVSRVSALSSCHACHGLRPRGADRAKPLAARSVLTSGLCDPVVLSPLLRFRGSVPSAFRLTACVLAVLRLRLGITPRAPRTRYPAAGQALPGRDSLPLDLFKAALPGRTTNSVSGKKYESGLHWNGKTAIYTSRGFGIEPRPAPQVRFLCRPEITLITIHPVNSP